jgi:glycosyltransferase involved in cell wall biosynthesis
LKTYARQHNLDNVYFLGFVNQSQLPKVYAVADIFVLPSVDEPWGLIINEVMCAGLPVIASAEIGAVPDLVHDGENGFTFEAGDIDMLQSHLETLCRDRLLRERMGKASREIISQWSYEECVQGVLAALDFVR